jgi:hypothetical protein
MHSEFTQNKFHKVWPINKKKYQNQKYKTIMIMIKKYFHIVWIWYYDVDICCYIFGKILQNLRGWLHFAFVENLNFSLYKVF